MRIVDDQFDKLIEALTSLKQEIKLNKDEIGKNKSEIEAIANKLNDKAPMEGVIAIVGTIEGVPGTVDGGYVAKAV